jgi:hypothetical protein
VRLDSPWLVPEGGDYSDAADQPRSTALPLLVVGDTPKTLRMKPTPRVQSPIIHGEVEVLGSAGLPAGAVLINELIGDGVEVVSQVRRLRPDC